MQDILSSAAILEQLGPGFWRPEVVEATDSTNTRLKERARLGEPGGLVLAADRQTAGRGRLGRSFASPGGTGIYFSMLLRPALPLERCTDFTPAAAVCTARAVEELCGIPVAVKWVNDLYCGGKKLCGILTEAAPAPNGTADYVVVGIGLNLRATGHPELSQIATSVEEAGGRVPTRAGLIAAILREFGRYCADPLANYAAMAEDYRRRMFLTGREVTLSTDPLGRPHRVEGLDDRLRLVVRTPEGDLRTLSTGEVSVRSL